MNQEIKDYFTKHEQDIEKIHKQRRLWLWASSVVLVGIIFLIFSWDWIDHFHSSKIWWVITSMMLIISVNWWYWTMRVVRITLCHQQVAHGILKSILLDISEFKKDIRPIVNQNIDKTE